MQRGRFFKLSGGGNDFIAFAEPERDPEPHEIRALCRRGVSLGADGLFVLRRTADGVSMAYWNADGSLGELCLNGTRCAARLAQHVGWATDQVTIVTDSGHVQARRAGTDRISLDVPVPPAAAEELELKLDSGTWRGWRTAVGVPHFVVEWPASLAGAPVEELGSEIRWAPEFPAGTNVMFVRYVEQEATDRSIIEIRSFERGVEAETLACGSGILASTQVGVQLERVRFPIDVVTPGGFPFRVDGKSDDGVIRAWSLTGDARVLAEGELQDAAMTETAPPSWSA